MMGVQYVFGNLAGGFADDNEIQFDCLERLSIGKILWVLVQAAQVAGDVTWAGWLNR